MVEISDDAFTVREVALYNATRKCLTVAAALPNEIVLAADTLVAIDNAIIGKPRDLDDATSILQRLSGRTHHVCTAVAICHFRENRRLSFCEISQVRFRRLTSDAIRSYLAKISPLDKAGAYAAQGAGSEIIEKIDGSFTNVVGLPMERTASELRGFGIEPVER